MSLKRTLVVIGTLAALAGCSQVDAPSRAAPFVAPELQGGATAPALRSYEVRDVRVVVPADLSVSEANSFYPVADIVWRGDAFGDRKQQVAEIIATAFQAGTAGSDGAIPVVIDITVERFHSLTERTRYTVGGVHSINFVMSVRHAETGAYIEAPRSIDASFPGLGGQAAIEAEQRGQGQKVRILDHLAGVARQELGV